MLKYSTHGSNPVTWTCYELLTLVLKNYMQHLLNLNSLSVQLNTQLITTFEILCSSIRKPAFNTNSMFYEKLTPKIIGLKMKSTFRISYLTPPSLFIFHNFFCFTFLLFLRFLAMIHTPSTGI